MAQRNFVAFPRSVKPGVLEWIANAKNLKRAQNVLKRQHGWRQKTSAPTNGGNERIGVYP
jgi:hypothetical protein